MMKCSGPILAPAVCFALIACSAAADPEQIFDLDVKTYSASVKFEIEKLLKGKAADHPLVAQRSRLDAFIADAAKATGTWHFKSDRTFRLELIHPNGKPLRLAGTWHKPQDARGDYVITTRAGSPPLPEKDQTTRVPSKDSILEMPFFMSALFPGEVGKPGPTFRCPFKPRAEAR